LKVGGAKDPASIAVLGKVVGIVLGKEPSTPIRFPSLLPAVDVDLPTVA